MKLLLSFVVILSVLLLSTVAFSQVPYKKILLVSDIDDTIKISHVLAPERAGLRILDAKVPFTGMAQLYQLLSRQTGVQVVYLSNAPAEIAQIPLFEVAHTRFLNENKFPNGRLLLRDDITDQNHKIRMLRALYNQEKPDVFILIGDNGEKDVQIYHQFQSEVDAKTKTVTFIHQIYGTEEGSIFDRILKGQITSAEVGQKIFPEQFGYVTPIEISLELASEGLLAESSKQWMLNNILPYILKQQSSIFSD